MANTFVVPQEMKDLDQWVGVKLVTDEDHPGKKKKIPVNPKTGKPLSGAWHEKFGWKFSEVKTSLKGFALRATDNLSILDFDFANVPDHPSYAFAHQIVKELHSFTEVSASGNGLHIVVKGKIPKRIYEKDTLGLEVYSEKRFFLITGKQFNGSNPTLAGGQKVLDRLFKEYGENEPEPTPDFNGHRKTIKSNPELEETIEIYTRALADHRADDREEWLEILFCLHAYYEGSPKGLELADEFSKRCPVKYTRRAVENAWRSAQKFGGKAVGFSRLEQRVMEDNPQVYGPMNKKELPPKEDPGPTSEPKTKKKEADVPDLEKLGALQAKVGRFEARSFSLLSEPLAPVNWLIDHHTVAGSVNLVYGASGSKKTYVEMHKALCIASGKSFLGRSVKQGPVLLIDEQSGTGRLERRYRQVLRPMNIGEDLPIKYVTMAGFDFGQKSKNRDQLIALLQEIKPVFVLVDALRNVIKGDENASELTVEALNFVKQLAEDFGTAFDIIHHENKVGGARGSTGIEDEVDSSLHVESKPYENPVVTFEMGKNRETGPFKYQATTTFVEEEGTREIIEFKIEPMDYTPEAPNKQLIPSQSFIVDQLKQGPKARTSLTKGHTEFNSNTLETAVKTLLKNGQIIEVTKKGRTTILGLATPSHSFDDAFEENGHNRDL